MDDVKENPAEVAEVHKKRKRKPRPKHKHQLPKGEEEYLFVDALNFSGSFFDFEDHSNLKVSTLSYCLTYLKRPEERINNFLQAASASGWTVFVFIDNVAKTKEAQEKWRTRREREVRTRQRRVPQCVNRLNRLCIPNTQADGRTVYKVRCQSVLFNRS